MTATRGAVAVTGDRNTIIRHRRIAFLDKVGRYVGMLRARYAVPLASDVPTVEVHGRGARFDLAAVVGVVADADKINHGTTINKVLFPGKIYIFCYLMPRSQHMNYQTSFQ